MKINIISLNEEIIREKTAALPKDVTDTVCEVFEHLKCHEQRRYKQIAEIMSEGTLEAFIDSHNMPTVIRKDGVDRSEEPPFTFNQILNWFMDDYDGIEPEDLQIIRQRRVNDVLRKRLDAARDKAEVPLKLVSKLWDDGKITESEAWRLSTPLRAEANRIENELSKGMDAVYDMGYEIAASDMTGQDMDRFLGEHN